jgi:S-adenosylmethionine-diacylglycerol 3-amino-3-carboxypropyl transferase
VHTRRDRFDQIIFDALYSRSLVYNSCWEDPAVDRTALNLRPGDTLLVITSAGCNVLDYALTSPCLVHAVDANPRQTALLELKLTGIRLLEFDDFFAVFGSGSHKRFRALYTRALGDEISLFARAYWDKRTDWFADPRDSFYFYGLSGVAARLFHAYMKVRPRFAASVAELLEARSLEDQRLLYDTRVSPLMWKPEVNWTLSRQITMSMLGVPHPQRKQVQQQHVQGVAGFVRESVEYVFRQLPVWTNYFRTLYARGRYTETCCPEYLKADNFQALKAGLVDRIVPHTCTVTQFLHDTEERISKYVLDPRLAGGHGQRPRDAQAEGAAGRRGFLRVRRAAPGRRGEARPVHSPIMAPWVCARWRAPDARPPAAPAAAGAGAPVYRTPGSSTLSARPARALLHLRRAHRRSCRPWEWGGATAHPSATDLTTRIAGLLHPPRPVLLPDAVRSQLRAESLKTGTSSQGN